MTAQVVIAGGGPVGMGMAIDLAQRGVKVTVAERHVQPQPIPRGQNLTQRTMEHFAAWGVEAAVRAACTIPKSYGIGGLTAYGTLLGTYHYDWLQRALVRPYYNADNERLPQYETERVLRARAGELPGITLHYGARVTAVKQDDVSAAVMLEDGTALGGDYVVACDGSRSVVRDSAGITQTRSDHDRLMVLLVFRSPALHTLLERYPGKSYYNVLHPRLKGYWSFFGRVDLGQEFFFHAPVPAGTTADNFDFHALLHEAVGAPFAVEIRHIGFWDMRFTLADSYRAGRIFVAGDAAHSHPPYGGYGINTGLEDARNLGWKLAAVLHGQGGASLLDSYDAERRPVFASTAADFIARSIAEDRDFLASYDPETDRAAFEAAWAARAGGASGEVDAFEPNYRGSPIIAGSLPGRPSARGNHSFEARAGHHLAPQTLSDGRSVYAALGSGFTLLALDADAAPFAAWPGLTVVHDSFSDGRARYGARLVLIRPDHFVAWAADVAPTDPDALRRTVLGI